MVSFFPLMSLFMSIALASGDSGSGPSPEASASDVSGSVSVLPILIMLLFLVIKVSAIVGSFRKWYYAWLYHSLELHLVIFIIGLFAVIATLNQPFNGSGFIRIIVIFLCLFINFRIKNYWLSNDNRGFYKVNHYSHA